MILVDTHVVLWLALDAGCISKSATQAITEARKSGGGLAISDITLVEITNLANKGRIELRSTLETFLDEVEAKFIVFGITGRVCVKLTTLPASYPNDPADRIIGATALVEGVPLVTADEAIRRSKAVATIW